MAFASSKLKSLVSCGQQGQKARRSATMCSQYEFGTVLKFMADFKDFFSSACELRTIN
jgi:hypothetical protein